MAPDVSVVITVKDDHRVVESVDAILTQEAPFSFEVVVVDNRSRPGFFDLLQQRIGTNPRVRLLQSGGNLSEAWNAAARTADTPILVRIDADAVPGPGWLTSLTGPLRSGAADWTAGPVGGVDPTRSLVARYFHHRTEAYSRRLGADPSLRDAVPSWNVAYARAALERAGWYDPWQASSVDWDLHKRLKQSGLRGAFVPEARCLHHHPATWREFLRKEAWYRTGQYQMALKYGFREMTEAFLLPAAYGILVILLVASLLWRPAALIALVFFLGLLAKHWVEGFREGDPLWAYRGLFRPIEGLAGIYGLARGLVRYGLRRPTARGPT